MNNEKDTPDMEDEEDNIIVLADENGEEVEFEILDLIEYESEEYVILLPAEQVDSEEIGEVVILKVEPSESEDDVESYVGVEDEETLNKVFEIFKEKFKDEFNYIDD